MQEVDRSGETVYGKKGSYSNLSKLGDGGMKVVYNATDDQQGNEVVVIFPTTIMPNTERTSTGARLIRSIGGAGIDHIIRLLEPQLNDLKYFVSGSILQYLPL